MDINERVRQFITTNFYVTDVAGLPDEGRLLDMGIVDSTGVLEVITFLESEFGIRVEDKEITPDNLDSISRIVAFIHRKKP